MLWFEGELMPEPEENGWTLKPEKVWSEHTARAADTTMIGDVKGIKNTVSIKWPRLDAQQIKKINSYLTNKSRPFFKVKYIDIDTDDYVESYFYAGTPTYPLYRWENGVKKYEGVGVDIIQQ